MTSESTGDDLTGRALEIANDYLLKKVSFKELSKKYYAAPSTLHRRLQQWLQEGRFELLDRQDKRTKAQVVGIDDNLGELLARKTKIWRVHVARISGAEAASWQTEPIHADRSLTEPESQRALLAYRAGDELHRALGEVAASYLLSRLRRQMTLGLASGRGVGFTIMELAELKKKKPAWVAGFESIRLISLSGGAHAGAWVMPVSRDLDADENVFHLAEILNVPVSNVAYMKDWVSMNRHESQHLQQLGFPASLDLVLIGLGQLNTQHHFFQHNLQYGSMTESLRRIKDYQSENADLRLRIAEITHRLFPIGGTEGLSEDFLAAIDDINSVVVSVPLGMIRQAGEIIIVAGGAQKLEALLALVSGRLPGEPVSLGGLMLITDAWTAETLLQKL